MESVNMKELVEIIANVGFPCVVAIYLLVRMEIKIGQLTENIAELSRVLQNVGK